MKKEQAQNKEKKPISPDNVFAGMPFICSYFKDMDGKIRHLRQVGGKEEEVERLKKKRSALYERAKYMDSYDLQMIYYAHAIKRIDSYRFLDALKKLYEAQEELLSLVGRE